MWTQNLTHIFRGQLSNLFYIYINIYLVVACRPGTGNTPTYIKATQTSAPAVTAIPAIKGALRIWIEQEGLYQLTREELLNVMPGWENVNPERFHLTLRGQSQPLFLMDRGGNYRLIFWGYPANNRYSGGNVYLLDWIEGETQPMLERQLTEASASSTESTSTSIHLEQNNIYAPQVLDGDHFFWMSLAGHQKADMEVDLPKLSSGVGVLRIHIWGKTSSPEPTDHHLKVSINDRVLIDEMWDGAGRQTLEAEIPDGILKDGKNIIVLETPGDTGAAAEINLVDWLELDYVHRTEADQDALLMQFAPETIDTSLHLSGFSGPPFIVDITEPTQTMRVLSGAGEDEFNFLGEAGHRYQAVGPRGFLSPVGITTAELTPDLRAKGAGADFIAIGAQDLLQPLTPLLEWREAQGLRVMSISIEAVYDQFNGGNPEPDAIRAFIAYAVNNWQPAPRFLLLVGDATYDPRRFISTPEANRLPVIFVQTHYGGETASDVLYGDADGDLQPDIAVGRIPAQEADQVRVVVEKTLEYERDSGSKEWRRRILAIADGQETGFKADAQTFLDQAVPVFQGTLYAPDAGVEDAPVIVKGYIDEGYGLVAYFGHGSIDMWGKDRIFKSDDVSSLSNRANLPIVINMTCLTGLFIHPKVTSLTESILWYEGGGGVAMLAPTSLTLPGSQSLLSQALINSIAENPEATLGENFLRAQRQVPLPDDGAREVLLTFTLFGDPALRLNFK